MPDYGNKIPYGRYALYVCGHSGIFRLWQKRITMQGKLNNAIMHQRHSAWYLKLCFAEKEGTDFRRTVHLQDGTLFAVKYSKKF